jgi:hypothetical protein
MALICILEGELYLVRDVYAGARFALQIVRPPHFDAFAQVVKKDDLQS